MSAPPCPSAEDLQRLLRGQASAAEKETLESHLRSCARCTAVIQQLQAAEPSTPGEHTNLGDLATVAGTLAPAPAFGVCDPELVRFLAPSQAADEIGRLGPYRVQKVLGKGGMGVVYQAHDPQADRQIALKVMLPNMATQPEARERFLREARSTAAIEHDHIVPLYVVSEDHGVPYLAMPLLKGTTLEDWLKQRERDREPLSLAEILRLGRETALGLAAAHERGLIHRDIKPANLWLDAAAGNRIKILDFGLARPTVADAHITQPGVIVGTASYMAPEQARAEAIDHRADLYSLGCVLYRLCTGQVPFTGKDAMAVLIEASTQEPKPVRQLNPAVPPALADLVMQLLAKKPAGRPASADEVARRLRALERQLVPEEMTTLDMPALPRQRGGRKLAAVLVLGLVVLLAGAVVFLKTERNPTATESSAAAVVDPTPPAQTTAQTPTPTTAQVAIKDPAFERWVKETSQLPPKEQMAAVMKKLHERNPRAMGMGHFFTVKGKGIHNLTLISMVLTDLTPLRAIPTLKVLVLQPGAGARNHVADLTPLHELSLQELDISHTRVKDLSPLHGMSTLKVLTCTDTEVTDLSPLKGLKLVELNCDTALVPRHADLLKKMPVLKTINGKPAAEALERKP